MAWRVSCGAKKGFVLDFITYSPTTTIPEERNYFHRQKKKNNAAAGAAALYYFTDGTLIPVDSAGIIDFPVSREELT